MRHAKELESMTCTPEKKGRQQRPDVNLTKISEWPLQNIIQELTLREITLSVSERRGIMIKEVKYDDSLYQIENISKEKS